jgi:hypothetical protein
MRLSAIRFWTCVVFTVCALSGCKESTTYSSINLTELRTNAGLMVKIETISITDLGAGDRNDVRIGMIRADQKRVMIGDANVSDDFVLFARSLQEGREYDAKQTLEDFEKKIGRKLEDRRTKSPKEKVIIRR